MVDRGFQPAIFYEAVARKSAFGVPCPSKLSGEMVSVKECRKRLGKAEAGNSCLQTAGTCESCPDWVKRPAPKRHIGALKAFGSYCMSCGKSSVRRKGKSPAPIRLVAGQITCSLCMTCAKQISNRLDVIIAAIEERYGQL